MKDNNNFLNRKNEVCYIPEAEDAEYTYFDLLSISFENPELCERLFQLLDWQHPETLIQEWIWEGEIDEQGNFLDPKY